jgi:hypothetical protein
MSSLLHQTKRMGEITGIPITRGGTTINHLFFADDSLLFCWANLREWEKIQEVLACYEAALRRKVNRDKIDRNTKHETRSIILREVGVAST